MVLCGLTSCVDELPYEKTHPGEGYSNVTFTMSFHPETSVSLGDTRAAAGDAIKDINNLFIIFFDTEGKDTGIHYYIEKPETTMVDRDNAEYSTTELQTVQATCTCKNVPNGMYRIYAVANMGNLAENEYKEQIKTETDFKQIRFKWNTDISANAQMSGYFTTGNEYERTGSGDYRRNAKEVTIDKSVKSLHAWLRRAVSKVTVDYDATKLREGIYIYLKSVKLVNIPASCSLIEENKPESNEDLIFDGDKIVYGKKEDGEKEDEEKEDEEKEETESANAYILAKGHPYIDGHEQIHENTATAMFFYENMQGKGEEGKVTDKRQQVLNDQDAIDENRPSYPHGTEAEKGDGYRDGMVNGTYVEVDAYYVSNATGNVGRGPIKYRFMLGKDVKIDYNAERNHHYKLTLKFNGNANDVDWHIEYKEEDAPGVYVPDYYVSYLYNQPYIDYKSDDSPGKTSYWEKCYPIRLAGTTIGNTVTVRIIENNWYPTGETGDLNTIDFYNKDEYLSASEKDRVSIMRQAVKTSLWDNNDWASRRPRLKTSFDRSGIWHGFLSLYPQEGQAQIPSDNWGRFSAGEYIYWYGRGEKIKTLNAESNPLSQKEEYDCGEGFRTFNTTLDDLGKETGEKVYNSDYGAYKVVKSIRNGMHETTIYIPLYTRPLIINQKKGFTGNNPYFSFQRTAKLQINTTINGQSYEKTATVNQVRRIINPKGIFRSWDNITPFKVTLMYRTSEKVGNNDFVAFPSEEGPWRATIVAGDGWLINGGTRAEGPTNSAISFTVQPQAPLGDATQTACALVRVEYHNYHCVHYIHLRQGYAPLSLASGTPYWHSFNMRYIDENTNTAYECDTELDGGSMFRYGNLTQPIDGINNNFENRFTTNLPWNTQNFVLAPIGETERSTNQFASWSEITPASSFTKNTFKVDGVEGCRMTKYADFYDLKNNKEKEIDFSLGVCYGDEATENTEDDDFAFYYSWFARKGAPQWLRDKNSWNERTGKDPEGRSGVRGCFIYNHKTADVVFLSLGACSYGRRKGQLQGSNNTPIPGIMRYGDFDKTFIETNSDQGPYVPQLHGLNENYGAIYWLSDKVSVTDGTAVAWDINYGGIDFNSIYEVNLHTNSNNADAAYIRLVQDEKPTLEQCKAIDKRVKAYQENRWWEPE